MHVPFIFFKDIIIVFQMSELPHQRALRECLPYLLDNVRAKDLMDHLFARGALTEEDMEDIEEYRGNIKMTRKMILILIRQKEPQFQIFLEALRQTSSKHVVAKLKEQIKRIRSEGSKEGNYTTVPV